MLERGAGGKKADREREDALTDGHRGEARAEVPLPAPARVGIGDPHADEKDCRNGGQGRDEEEGEDTGALDGERGIAHRAIGRSRVLHEADRPAIVVVVAVEGGHPAIDPGMDGEKREAEREPGAPAAEPGPEHEDRREQQLEREAEVTHEEAEAVAAASCVGFGGFSGSGGFRFHERRRTRFGSAQDPLLHGEMPKRRPGGAGGAKDTRWVRAGRGARRGAGRRTRTCSVRLFPATLSKGTARIAMSNSTAFATHRHRRLAGRATALAAAAEVLALLAVPLPRPVAAAISIHYALIPDSSRVHIHTGSSGIFGFAGHEHTVSAGDLIGRAAVDSTDMSAFMLSITFPADSLRVIDEERRQDSPKIERDMREKVLESRRFPLIEVRGVTFTPKREDPGTTTPLPIGNCSGTIVIELALHGTTRTLTLPIDLEIDAHRLRARGELTIKHEDFAMKRVKVAGVVNVAEELEIDFDIRGRRVAGQL